MPNSHTKVLVSVYKEFLTDITNRATNLGEFYDKIIVWIMSLSTGAIALLISSFEKLNFVDKSTINLTLILLVTVIVCGIVGRILYAIASHITQSFIALFTLDINLLDIPYNPRLLTGSETVEEIYEFVKEDFKQDVTLLLEHKKLVPKENWNKVDEHARSFYNEYADWHKESYNDAATEIGDLMIKAFGYKKNYFEKSNQTNNRVKGILLRVSAFMSYTLYVASASLFALAILKLTINFIGNNQ